MHATAHTERLAAVRTPGSFISIICHMSTRWHPLACCELPTLELESLSRWIDPSILRCEAIQHVQHVARARPGPQITHMGRWRCCLRPALCNRPTTWQQLKP